MKLNLRKVMEEAKPASINVANIISKLRRIRIEIHEMADSIDSALERIDNPVDNGDSLAGNNKAT